MLQPAWDAYLFFELTHAHGLNQREQNYDLHVGRGTVIKTEFGFSLTISQIQRLQCLAFI